MTIKERKHVTKENMEEILDVEERKTRIDYDRRHIEQAHIR